MDSNTLMAIAAIVTALGSFGVALSLRRKNTADAGRAASESVQHLLGPLNERIAALALEVKELRVENGVLKRQLDERDQAHALDLKMADEQRRIMQAEIDELRNGVGVLSAQLEAAGVVPRYRPRPTGPVEGER